MLYQKDLFLSFQFILIVCFDYKGSRLDMTTSGSQLSLFRDFLLRANKYNTLDIFGGGVMTRKIICVEVSF